MEILPGESGCRRCRRGRIRTGRVLQGAGESLIFRRGHDPEKILPGLSRVRNSLGLGSRSLFPKTDLGAVLGAVQSGKTAVVQAVKYILFT